MKSGPGLLPRLMSGSMALLQPGFVLMSVVPVATEGLACSLGQHLRPWVFKGHAASRVTRSVWFGLLSGAMVMSIRKLWLRAMSGFVALHS